MKSEAETDKVEERPSRDSKWLLPAISLKTDGPVTRRTARKFAPKVSLRASKQKKHDIKANKKSSNSKPQTSNPQRRRSDLQQKNSNSLQKRSDSQTKSFTLKAQNNKSRKRKQSSQSESQTKQGNTGKKIVKTKPKLQAEVVLEGENVIHIRTDVGNENHMIDNEYENKRQEEIDNEDMTQMKPRKRSRKTVKDKIEIKQEECLTEDNGFPTIEDELKLIEGEAPRNGKPAQKQKVKESKKAKKRKGVQGKPPHPTRHCNLCPESFFSELDLAQHCREKHFKHTFVLKGEGIETLLAFTKTFSETDRIVDGEHQYAKEKANRTEEQQDEDNKEIDDSEMSSQLGMEQNGPIVPVEESIVVVRKVNEQDRRHCPFCHKMFLSDKGLKDHIEMRCKDVPFRCFCGKGLGEENELHTHYPNFKIPKYKNSRTRIECEFCKMKFTFRETYRNHTFSCPARENADYNSVREEAYVVCPVCSQVFSNESSLKKHEKAHHTGIKNTGHECDVCGKEFASKSGLTTHAATHSDQKRFICEHCGAGFNQKGNLMTHLKSSVGLCKGMKGVNALMMECNLCKRSFTSLNRLKQHEKKHERVNDMLSPDGITCKDCGKRFKAIHELKRHVMIHTGEKPHVCSFCKKGFAQKSNMMAHMRIHTGYRPYECYICGQGFTQGTTLKVHVEKNHDLKTYKFKKLPRGRRFKDSNTNEQIMDIEQEYIEKALSDNSFVEREAKRKNTDKSKIGKVITSKGNDAKASNTKEIGTQADDMDSDDEYLSYEDEEDEPNKIDEYRRKRMETDSAPANHAYVKVESNEKETPRQKIYFQLVQNGQESQNNTQFALDTKGLQEVIRRSLYDPNHSTLVEEVIEETIQAPSEVRQLSDHANRNAAFQPQKEVHTSSGESTKQALPQAHREFPPESEEAIRRLSEVAVKRSVFESARAFSPEALRRFLTEHLDMQKGSVTVSQPGETHKTVNDENASHVVATVSQIPPRTSVVTDDRGAYSVPPKHTVSMSDTQSVPEALDMTVNSQGDHLAHFFRTIGSSSGENVVVIQSQIDSNNISNNPVYSNATESVDSAYKLETLTSQPQVHASVTETLKAVNCSPLTESVTRSTISEVANKQASVENSKDLVQTYQVVGNASDFSDAKNSVPVTQSIIYESSDNSVLVNQTPNIIYESAESSEPGVEYVTVIFEDDGTDTVEQEIDLTQSDAVAEVQEVHVMEAVDSTGHEMPFVPNAEEIGTITEVADAEATEQDANLITLIQ